MPPDDVNARLEEKADRLLSLAQTLNTRLSVIEERTEGIRKDIDRYRLEIERDIREIKEDMESFVLRSEFEPIRKIVFGAVSIILTAFVGALIVLVGWR